MATTAPLPPPLPSRDSPISPPPPPPLLSTPRYQLIFRHLFHCKHVERQLSSSWLSQQATKALAATKDFSASYGLRQRMLHFLHNIEHYMMFEV